MTAANSANHVATTNHAYAVALSRAFAGALLFCLPLLMTMEMWWLGFYLEPWRVALFTAVNILILYGLSKVSGFEESHNWTDDILDAFAAYFVAVVTAAAILWLIGAIRPAMTIGEMAGMVAIQAVPASFGAMIGAKLLGEGEEIEEAEEWRDTYGGQLFLFLAGALFLSFTVAPTEEILLIALQMDPAQSLLLVALSVLLLHAILYIVHFHGQEQRFTAGHARSFITQTLPGYAVTIAAVVYILWSFGRLDGLGLGNAAAAIAVLGFPASIGAGIARIVV
ncbi:TIGR02587 family membrane protein [Sphingomonas mesophila]|uniref:TIGR02587 family membrane protein n=1 Tax=Sphingomonas mesophila TaxID=2303576 RepID=UPI000E583379|nr:TIGR02587 family membrane protein [Sphingomonas mesophila]